MRRGTDPFNSNNRPRMYGSLQRSGRGPTTPNFVGRGWIRKSSPLDARAGLHQCLCDMTYEEFLEHAEECERLAETARLPSNRHALLSAAEMWRKMAADIRPRDGRDQIVWGGARTDT